MHALMVETLQDGILRYSRLAVCATYANTQQNRYPRAIPTSVDLLTEWQ